MILSPPKTVIFVVAFILAIALYWPALNGSAIWDDSIHWFDNHRFVGDYSYLTFWKKFAWPLSTSLQRFLSHWWGKNYYLYHLLNLSLHFSNALMLYFFFKKIKFFAPVTIFLLFLLSPVCTISVGWLIQMKTLLCFFFGIATLLVFLKALENNKWIVPSWILFFCCVAAKSALITLPIIILILSFKNLHKWQFLIILPFFLISGMSAYRVLNSKGTIDGQKSLEKSHSEKRIDIEEKGKSPIMILSYYFWQVISPIDNAPVKGFNNNQPDWSVYVYVLFILLVLLNFFISPQDPILIYLAAGHVLLLPFLGIVSTPFMLVSWVSDQHLYGALPAFLCFWIIAISHIKHPMAWILPIVLGVFFSFKTYQSAHFYKNEFTFYEESLNSNPANLAISYNLASAYLEDKQIEKSLVVLKDALALSDSRPELKTSPFYQHLINLYGLLQNPSTQEEK